LENLMNAQAVELPRWTTASIADAADTKPMELRALGAHVERCNGSRGRWFALRCAVDAVHEFVASRFVTTLIIVGLAVGVIAYVV
jgi:hypothetical protein